MPKLSSNKRFLAAVMFTDIAGFSTLVERDESLAKSLHHRHRSVMEAMHKTHHGLLVQYFGDGTLSIFDSATNAVQCAIEIQQALQEEPLVPLRIGIHLGEVIYDLDGLFGHSVNLASRLESFAIPGSVLISEKLYEEFKNQPLLKVKYLGAFEFKNVLKPMKIYALANEGLVIPDPKKLEGKGRMLKDRTHNFPSQLTSFIGREREVFEIKGLLQKSRLVTLTGTGGTGKTRLSIQVAEEVAELFPDGVYFVPLAPVREPEMVVSAIAKAVNVLENPTRSLQESLEDFFDRKKLLLILDNFEQVVNAAPAVFSLLKKCRFLHILVSSRVVLQIQGEQEYPVQPLSLPDIKRLIDTDRLMGYPSIELFIDRSRKIRPDFELTSQNAFEIAEICRRLDGLPLAIELAAVRIKLFPPAVLLKKLNKRLDIFKDISAGRPERHQTLRQAISWSYDLLEEEEKAFFRSLSVFSGGFTFESAEKICLYGVSPQLDVYDLISELLNKSLVQDAGEVEGEPRFFLLETIREYGMDLLKDKGEATAVHRRYTQYFLQLAEEASPHLAAGDQRFWLERLEADHDNLRTAIIWAVENNELEWGLRLGWALWRFWAIRSHMIEGRRRLTQMLQLPSEDISPLLRAKVTSAVGSTLNMIALPIEAKPFLEESLALFRLIGDEEGIAQALNNLGWSEIEIGNYDKGINLSLEAKTIYEKLGIKRGFAVSHNNLGWAKLFTSAFSESKQYHEKCRLIRQEVGDLRGYAFGLTNQAWAETLLGSYEAAKRKLDEALNILVPIRDKQLIAWAKTISGANRLWSNQPAEAYSLLLEVEDLWQEVGNVMGRAVGRTLMTRLLRAPQEKFLLDPDIILKQSENLWQQCGSSWGLGWHFRQKALFNAHLGNISESRRDLLQSLKIEQKTGNALGMVEGVEGYIFYFSDTLEIRSVVSLLAVSSAEREQIASKVKLIDQQQYEDTIANSKTSLGEEAFRQAWDKGKKDDFWHAMKIFVDLLRG